MQQTSKLSWTVFASLLAAPLCMGQSQSKCPELTQFRLPGVTVEITRAAWVPAGPMAAGYPS